PLTARVLVGKPRCIRPLPAFQSSTEYAYRSAAQPSTRPAVNIPGLTYRPARIFPVGLHPGPWRMRRLKSLPAHLPPVLKPDPPLCQPLGPIARDVVLGYSACVL